MSMCVTALELVLCSIHCACGCPQGVKTPADLLEYVHEFGEQHLVLYLWMSMFLLTSLRLITGPVAKKFSLIASQI